VAGQDVVIDAADWDRLVAFQSCAEAGPAPEAEQLIAMDNAELRARLDAARACDEVPGAPNDWVKRLETELATRRSADAGALSGPRTESFEEALATFPPVHRIPGNAAVDVLKDSEKLRGSPVLLRGKLVDFLEANIAVLEVEGRHVWVYGCTWTRPAPGVPR
jgi:hypothetical protein